MVSRSAPLPEVLAAICHALEAGCDGSLASAVVLVDGEGQRWRLAASPSLCRPGSDSPPAMVITAAAAEQLFASSRNDMLVATDIDRHPGWMILADGCRANAVVCGWAIALRSGAGDWLGTLDVYFNRQRDPTEAEHELARLLATNAVLAIERQRADDTLRASERRNRFLSELADATESVVDAQDVMTTTARMLSQHLAVDRCAYAEIQDETVCIVTGQYSAESPAIEGRWPLAAFGPECRRKLLEAEPYVVADVETDPLVSAEHLAVYRDNRIRAVICVPLHKDGRLSAAMAVHQTVPRQWTSEEIELVRRVVARCWETLERSRVTRTLLQSELRYRAMIEANPECVKLVAADGTLIQMNAAGLRMIEASDASAAVGHCVYNLIAPDHRASFQAFNEKVCRGEGGQLAFEIIGLEGTRRWMETTSVPLAWPSGGYAQLAVTRDVSAKVTSEREVAEGRARLDYAVRLSGVGFWYSDLPFDQLVWDKRVKEHFFLAPDASVDIGLFYERLHPEDREPTRQAIETSIRCSQPYDVSYRTIDPDSGATKWVHALGGATHADDGTPMRFDGVTVDVTAQKVDQLRLGRLLAGERERARLLREVADAARFIHAAGSLESVLQVITEQARRIIGTHQAVTSLTSGPDLTHAIHAVSMSEKYRAFDSYAAPPTGQGIYALVCETNEPMRMTQAELEAHPRWRNLSGEGDKHPRMRGWLAVPFVGRDGANLGLVQMSDKYDGEFTEADEAILTQLAQIAAVALENARLYDQLRDQDRRKDEFLATLAHELRNPLAPIRTGLQVLRETRDAEISRQCRDMMERQVGHLVHLVDDLLDISRITLGKINLAKMRIDARDIVDSALETNRALIESHGHVVTVDMPETPLPLDADPTRLNQVVANLLNNAVKYTPPGGRIGLSVTTEGDTRVIRVSDSGIGIAPEMLTRIFDMFTQLDNSMERTQGGLGIGLTLVRRLVELHGGRIEARSPGLGQGSTFVVRLPLPEADAPPAIDPSDAKSPLDSPWRPRRILVVDDNADAAATLCMLLELDDHTVAVAHDGAGALSAIGEFAPDVVFLDIGLPDLNGLEVARRLRSDPTVSQPLLIALTGWGTEDDRRQSRAAGFDLHLVKPVDASMLTLVGIGKH